MAYILALHQEGTSWKAALLCSRKRSKEIVWLKTLSQCEDPLHSLQPFLPKGRYQITTALNAETLVFRDLELNIKGWKNIIAVLPFQAEEVIPFPRDEMLIIPFLEGREKEKSTISLVSTRESSLEAHLVHMQAAGIDPHIVTTVGHAAKRWLQFFLPQYEEIFFLYVDGNNSFMIFLKKGRIAEFKISPLHNRGEWQRLEEYSRSLSKEASSIPWVIIGAPNREEDLLNQAARETSQIDSPSRSGLFSELHGEEISAPRIDHPSLIEYALPIGAALDALYADKHSAQFRLEKFSHLATKKKSRLLLGTALLLLLSTVAILSPITHRLLKAQKEHFIARTQDALQKLAIPMQNEEISALLETVHLKIRELSQESRFSLHTPTVTSSLDSFARSMAQLQRVPFPEIHSLEYRIQPTGIVTLSVQWKDGNIAVFDALHRALKKSAVHLTHWDQTSSSCHAVFEISNEM
jgi:hypothetical protein